MRDDILDEFNEHKEVLEATKALIPTIKEVSKVIANALKNGNKVLIFGNGGSAADAQHIAAELTGRYKKERIALAAIALTTDTSAITAISNDYGYDRLFERQVEAFCKKGDIVIGISTSGNSKNVIKGLLKAKELNGITISLSGNGGGDMRDISDYNLIVPSNNTPRIQEMHILIGHILCAGVDKEF